MLPPPPYIFGTPRFWASTPSNKTSARSFPVTVELYVAVREMLKLWNDRYAYVLDYEEKYGKNLVSPQGQPYMETLELTIPRILALYTNINIGSLQHSTF